MKKFLALFLTACVAISLSGCSYILTHFFYPDPDIPLEFDGVLYGDFSCGRADGRIVEKTFEYTGSRISPQELAEMLTEWTGLNFAVNAYRGESGSCYVEWSDESTLVAGLGDLEMKEEFTFADVDSLRWFMMDSYWRTLKDNLQTEEIYFSAADGSNLVFAELYPVRDFIADEPYRGSQYYFNANVIDSENLNAKLKGEWLYSDQENILVFDELGNYNWSFVDEVWFGTYTFDGETVKFYNAYGDHLANATLGDQGRLFVEGDAGSFYYKNTNVG